MNFRASILILLLLCFNSTFGIKIDLSPQNTCLQESPECLNVEENSQPPAPAHNVLGDSHQTMKPKMHLQEVSAPPSKANTLSQTIRGSHLLIQNLERIINGENVSPQSFESQDDVVILQNELIKLLKTLESSGENHSQLKNTPRGGDPPKESNELKEINKNPSEKSMSEKVLEEMMLLTKQLGQQQEKKHPAHPSTEELLYQTWTLMNKNQNNNQRERSTIGLITDTIFNITKLFVDGFFNNIEKIAFIFFFAMIFSFLCCVGSLGVLIYLFKRYHILSLCLNFISDINNRIIQLRNSVFDYYNQEREKLNQKQKKLREQGQMYLTALKEGYKRFDEIHSKKNLSQKNHLKKIREEPLKKYKEDDQEWIDCPGGKPKRSRKIISRSALQKQKLKKSTQVEYSDEEGSVISSQISQDEQDFHQCPCGRKLSNDYSLERNRRQISLKAKRAIFSELTETS